MAFRRAEVRVSLGTDAGVLQFTVTTGSLPKDRIGERIGEKIDAEIDKLFPPDMSIKEREKLEAEVTALAGQLAMARNELAAAKATVLPSEDDKRVPRRRGRPRKSEE